MKPGIDPLPPELEDLFVAERVRPGPPPQIAEQVLGGLQLAIVAASLGAPVKAASSVLAKVVTASVIAFTAGGIAGAAVVANLRAPMEPAAAVVEVAGAPAPAALPEPAEVAPQPQQPTPRPPKALRPTLAPHVAEQPAAPMPVPQAASDDAALSAERALLEQARASLTRQRSADATNALEQHLARFADGQLVEERESLWIQALVAAGDLAGAAAHARAFKRRFPQSIFQPAVEAMVPDDSVTE